MISALTLTLILYMILPLMKLLGLTQATWTAVAVSPPIIGYFTFVGLWVGDKLDLVVGRYFK